MGELFGFIWCTIAWLFRSRAQLQAEILVLRHQLNILRRRSPKRMALGKIDRLVFCALYRLSPTVLDALKILQPETVIRWHRAAFRAIGAGDHDGAAAGQGSPRTFACGATIADVERTVREEFNVALAAIAAHCSSPPPQDLGWRQRDRAREPTTKRTGLFSSTESGSGRSNHASRGRLGAGLARSRSSANWL